MKHYVVNLSVKPIMIGEFRTATFTEEQNTLCNKTIHVKSRNEFATKVNGIGVVDCPDCLRIYTVWMSRPFDCDECHEELKPEDIQALSRRDFRRLCIRCNNDEKVPKQ